MYRCEADCYHDGRLIIQMTNPPIHSSPSPSRHIRRFAVYILIFLFLISIPNFYALTRPGRKPVDLTVGEGPVNILMSKARAYKKNPGRFNTIFFGCSRVYFNIDCQLMDTALGTVSCNTGSIANWLPTQYAQLRDLIPHIPQNTVVVWSIGHHLFDNYAQDKVNGVYPISWKLIPDFLRMGYGPGDLIGNVLQYNLLIYWGDYIPGVPLVLNRLAYYDKLKNILETGFFKSGSKPADQSVPADPKKPFKNLLEYLRFKKIFSGKPGVLQVGVETTGQVITAAMVRKSQGNIILHELEPEHFRKYQRLHHRITEVRGVYKPQKKYWNTFTAMLDLFEKNNIPLIVNEFSDAPSVYGDAATRKRYDEFMDALKSYVEARGIPYIRVHQHTMPDDAYFDSDHYNSKGVILYDPRLAKALKPVMLKLRSKSSATPNTRLPK
jgi:hypothetical protein